MLPVRDVLTVYGQAQRQEVIDGRSIKHDINFRSKRVVVTSVDWWTKLKYQDSGDSSSEVEVDNRVSSSDITGVRSSSDLSTSSWMRTSG
ncbi:hypothetical protein LSH36_202g10012 [Paralvinella palmiformis]|uniref:Uncharacterized protein n=1 Tax=Paralvinella palmiformis TaxID=53620 RepID=A0AAD9N7G8_9ANNE|nr:hypothetical protein LSH36_202g10012 [Paralvinella palmiformis]